MASSAGGAAGAAAQTMPSGREGERLTTPPSLGSLDPDSVPASLTARSRLRKKLFASRVNTLYSLSGSLRSVCDLQRAFAVVQLVISDEHARQLLSTYAAAAGPLSSAGELQRRITFLEFHGVCEALLQLEESDDIPAVTDLREQRDAFAALGGEDSTVTSTAPSPSPPRLGITADPAAQATGASITAIIQYLDDIGLPTPARVSASAVSPFRAGHAKDSLDTSPDQRMGWSEFLPLLAGRSTNTVADDTMVGGTSLSASRSQRGGGPSKSSTHRTVPLSATPSGQSLSEDLTFSRDNMTLDDQLTAQEWEEYGLSPTPYLDQVDPHGVEARRQLAVIHRTIQGFENPKLPHTLVVRPKSTIPLYRRKPPKAKPRRGQAHILSEDLSPQQSMTPTPASERVPTLGVYDRLAGTGPRALRDTDAIGLESSYIAPAPKAAAQIRRQTTVQLSRPTSQRDLSASRSTAFPDPFLTGSKSKRPQPLAMSDASANAEIHAIFNTASQLGFLRRTVKEASQDRKRWLKVNAIMSQPTH